MPVGRRGPPGRHRPARRLPGASPSQYPDGVVVTGLPTCRRGRHGRVPPRRPRRCSSCSAIAGGGGRRHGRRTPPAAAAARGRGDRPRGVRAAAGLRRDRARRSACPSTSPTSAPRSARSARRSTRCSSTSRRRSSARHRSEQQVRQFVADASHELRTPLTTIAGYTELARSRPDDKAGRRHGPGQGRGGVRTDDRPGRGPAAPRPPRLRPPARQRTRRPHPAPGRGRLRRPRARPRPPVAAVAARGVRRGHRRRAAAAPGRRPTCWPTPASTRPPAPPSPSRAHAGGFAVHDDGPGFPDDLVDHAFERFARGDVARTRAGKEGGYGLGLSLVAAIVTAHGGTVALHSVPGDTTVSVELPSLEVVS